MEPKKSIPSRQNVKSHPTLLDNIFKKAFILILLSLVSWLLLLAWFGAKAVFLANYNAGFDIQAILESQFSFIGRYHKEILEMIFAHFNHIEYLVNSLFNYVLSPITSRNTANIVCGSLEIITVKISIFIISLPFIIVILGVFIIDGLVQRDVRKFQGERESTLFFHRSKSLSTTLFTFIFFIFMALPFPVSPQVILVPMSFLCGLIAMISIKNFKKYM